MFLAGQTSVDADGRALHAGDMAAQLERAFDNVEAVLSAAADSAYKSPLCPERARWSELKPGR
ncbi:MAG: hypothetical protein WB812_15560 [Woeseiaceae bacterium]